VLLEFHPDRLATAASHLPSLAARSGLPSVARVARGVLAQAVRALRALTGARHRTPFISDRRSVLEPVLRDEGPNPDIRDPAIPT